jgi:iron complex transport system permease protein
MTMGMDTVMPVRRVRRGLSLGRYLSVLTGLGVLLVVVFVLALTFGGSGLSLVELLRAVARGEEGSSAVILLDIRLPRAILAALAGMALAAAGTTFQAVLRNPLAEPYILGVSGGAAVGAILSVAAGAGTLGAMLPLRPLGAFAGALLTIAVIFRVASLRGRASSYSLILVGVVINSFFSAVILFIITVADFTRFQGVLFWMAGTLSSQPYPVLATLGILLALGMAGLLMLGSALNLVSQGEETAGQLGLDVRRIRLIALVAASLLTAAVVSFSGLIGFVGLMVPHIMRLAVGPDHRLLLPAAGLAGASFLLAADTMARALFAPTEIPVGIITAVIGGPFFIWLYRRQGGSSYFD